MSITTSHPLLVAALTSALQKATGRLLTLAPNGPALLARLRGRVIALELSPFRQIIYLCPADREIQVFTEISGVPDVTLRGSPSAFARMGLGGTLEKTLKPGDIEISGDSGTARRFQELVRQLDVDWSALFILLTRSPMLGSALADLLRASGRWSRDTGLALQEDVSDYLREEVRWLPVDAETDRFHAEVDALRAGRDRLQARIDRLNATLALPSSPASP